MTVKRLIEQLEKYNPKAEVRLNDSRGTTELDFFMDLIDMGITLKDIKEFCPDKYDYSKSFMEEHGLF